MATAGNDFVTLLDCCFLSCNVIHDQEQQRLRGLEVSPQEQLSHC